MQKKTLFKSTLGFLAILVLMVSCDKDFNTIGSSVIGNPNFGYDLYSDATVNAFNMATGAVQSNNLPINSLGIYNNPVFGKTKAGFVTQLSMAVFNPDFHNGTFSPDGKSTTQPQLDSVVLTVPYFSKKLTTTTDGSTYELDSIVGNKTTPIDLRVYESGYYMADYDPSTNFEDPQRFFNDQESTFDSHKVSGVLNNNSANSAENSKFVPSEKEFVTYKRNDDLTFKDKTSSNVDTRKSPRMSLHLDVEYFKKRIVNAPEGSLYNDNALKSYFKGLYFQVADADDGHMMRLDFTKGDVTLYFRGVQDTVGKTPAIKTFVFNMKGTSGVNTVNLLQQTYNPEYAGVIGSRSLSPIPNDNRLYVKGGEGSMTVIDLFGPNDVYGYSKRTKNGVPVDENGSVIALDYNGNPVNGYFTYVKNNTGNGVPDELDDVRYPKSPVAGDGQSQYYSDKYRWLINEANLTFYVDQSKIPTGTPEPQRVFLYDMNNRRPIYDYNTDVSTNADPKLNKNVLSGLIVKDAGGKGVKYEVRLTNHIRNLVKYADSTNVRLGLVVTESIGLVGNSKLKQSVDIPYFIKSKNARPFDRVPTGSVIHPLGSVFYGSTDQGSEEENKKRLKLEIYYTKPN